jgi:RNA polymerase sigma-70 factor (ECF subfamily)
VPLTAADRVLLQRCLHHEQGAWREFVDRFIGLIYHVIHNTGDLRNQKLRPEDTEDITAEILAQVVANNFALLRRFKGRSSLAGYLTVISRRICVHELNKRSGTPEVPLEEAPAPVNHQPPPAPAEADLETQEEVQRLLTRLTPRDRQVVRMFYIEGKTYDEISADLGMPRNSIGPILSRAREMLRQDTPSS